MLSVGVPPEVDGHVTGRGCGYDRSCKVGPAKCAKENVGMTRSDKVGEAVVNVDVVVGAGGGDV